MKKSGLSQLRSTGGLEIYKDFGRKRFTRSDVAVYLHTGRDNVTPDVMSQYAQEFVHLVDRFRGQNL